MPRVTEKSQCVVALDRDQNGGPHFTREGCSIPDDACICQHRGLRMHEAAGAPAASLLWARDFRFQHDQFWPII